MQRELGLEVLVSHAEQEFRVLFEKLLDFVLNHRRLIDKPLEFFEFLGEDQRGMINEIGLINE